MWVVSTPHSTALIVDARRIHTSGAMLRPFKKVELSNTQTPTFEK
jgi:hypothetical protein